MSSTVAMFMWVAIKLVVVAGVLLYSFLVFASYASDPRHSPRLDLTVPGRSAQHLLVWLGVKAVSAIVRSGSSVLDLLYDASADVGGWVVDKSGRRMRESVRSRFL